MLNNNKIVFCLLSLSVFISYTLIWRMSKFSQEWRIVWTDKDHSRDGHQQRNQRLDTNGTTGYIDYPAPVFLPNYRNPCWIERSPYTITAYSTSRKRTRRNHHLPNNSLACLPYFFIAGFQKSGTTDLHAMLKKHPDLVAPNVKEPHYWTRSRYVRGRTIGSYIRKYFSKATRVIAMSKQKNTTEHPFGFHPKITWEATPDTVYYNGHWKYDVNNNPALDEPQVTVADHIRHLLPKAKIILLIRHPTDRLYSDFLHGMRDNLPANPPESFHNKITLALDWFNNCTRFYTLRACLYYPVEENTHNWGWTSEPRLRLSIGAYSEHVKEWLRVFPKDQLLLIRLEDYASNRTQHLLRVVKFLGIKKPNNLGIWRVNTIANKNTKKKKRGSMLPETKRLLDDFYQPFLNRLALMFNDVKFEYNDRN